VPDIEGSLFGGRTAQAPAAGSYAAQYPYAQGGQPAGYAGALAALQEARAQNPGAAANSYGAAQAPGNDARAFYDSSGGGGALAPGDGSFLGDNSLWIGTLVPAVLESGVDTSLPGNVVARVTENIFDSRTGKNLLLPQGTLLFARYNSAVNYAQRRVQIVWDSLIRPDGYYVELGGMPAVDSEGFSGTEGAYHENWLEYLKAAGIITMFSLANASMTAEAAKHATEQAASNIAEANSQFVAQTGNAIVSRAMGVGPTVTVEQGTRLSIMLNKTVYFPPLPGVPAAQKYSLR
jgi:type IV secretion system protein VirB10